jgi:hypothetical protein
MPPAPITFAAGVEQLVSSSRVLSERLATISRAVHVTVAPKTRSGRAIQSVRGRLHEMKLDDVRPSPRAVELTQKRLADLGFNLIRTGRFAITASGPAELVAEALNINLTVFARRSLVPARATMNFAADMSPMNIDIFLAPSRSLTVPGRGVSDAVDHFVFTPPPISFDAPTADPPVLPYHHITADDIRRHLRVPEDATGAGIKVAIVDTGFYQHPYSLLSKLRPTDRVT